MGLVRRNLLSLFFEKLRQKIKSEGQQSLVPKRESKQRQQENANDNQSKRGKPSNKETEAKRQQNASEKLP